jgi:MFS family permease
MDLFMRSLIRISPSLQIYAAFALYAFAMASIFPRMGDFQTGMGVSKSALALGLIGTPFGTLASITFAPPFLERIGHRLVLLAGIPLIALFFAVAVHATTPLILFLLLIPVGLVIGCVEIIVNVEADRTEHALGYRIMNRSHAFWSFGFFAASFFGAWLASMNISTQMHLAIVVPVVLVCVLLALGQFKPAEHRYAEVADEKPKFVIPSMSILALFAITSSAMLLEGASMDWSAIYMRDVFNAGSFLAGFAVAVAAISQATARFFADPFIERYSPMAVARTLLALLFLGCVTVFLSTNPIVSLIGFAAIGIGNSAIFPLAISAAAQRQDRPAAVNVASLVQLSFTMFLLGPPLLGFVADHLGIRYSFGIALPLVVLGLLMSKALQKN